MHRPPTLDPAQAVRLQRRLVTETVDSRDRVVGESFGPWSIAVDLCVSDYEVQETRNRACTYLVNGRPEQGYEIWTRRKRVTAGGASGTWSMLFSTCSTGTAPPLTPVSGTPESLPPPRIWFVERPECEAASCPSGYTGNMDIFVVVPEDMVEQARPWLRLWVTIPNAVSAVRRMERDLLIVVDEMPALGLLKPMMDSYTMSAGRGVHFWGFAQSISVLDESWGAGNRQVLMDLAEVVQVLGFPRTDVDGAEKLSAAMGSASFENRSESHSGRSSSARVFAGASQLQVGDNVSVVKERVVPPDEILTMGPDRQFVVASPKDMPRDAFGLYHARYWTRNDARGLADPNPLVLRKREASAGATFGMFAREEKKVEAIEAEEKGEEEEKQDVAA